MLLGSRKVGKPPLTKQRSIICLRFTIKTTKVYNKNVILVSGIFIKTSRKTEVDILMCVTHFSPMFYFYIPLKTSENQRFSDVFRGYRNVTLRQNVLVLIVFSLLRRDQEVLQDDQDLKAEEVNP